MEKLNNIKEVKVADQQIEIDPRSKTTADKAFNYIGTGGPEMEVVKNIRRTISFSPSHLGHPKILPMIIMQWELKAIIK